MLVLFYGHYNKFTLFFKWDFNVLKYIQFAYGCSLRKILMFILFINIPMCQPLSIWTLFVLNCHFKCAWKFIIEVMYGNFLFNVMGGWNFCWHLMAFVINTKKKVALVYLSLWFVASKVQPSFQPIGSIYTKFNEF
jgi:hypothetical protein